MGYCTIQIMGDLQVDWAPIQNHSIGKWRKSGLTYNVIGTYFNQEGSLYNSDYEKFSLRSNTYFKNGRLVLRQLSLNISDQKKNLMLIYDAIRLQPYRKPIDASSDSFVWVQVQKIFQILLGN